MNNKFNKWKRWLDQIYVEILRLSLHNYIFKEVQSIIKNNKKIQKPSAFYDLSRDSYAAMILMGIRRQIKIDKNSISFARLLKEISENPKILSRKRYVSLYKNSLVKHLADTNFDRFSGKAENHVDLDMVKKDLDNLKKKVKTCEKYADRRVAHLDKRGIKTIPKLQDVNDCIDFLGSLLKKYYSLFTATTLATTVPVIQYDWKIIFKEPWLPSPNK